jgi:hypothetical protein
MGSIAIAEREQLNALGTVFVGAFVVGACSYLLGAGLWRGVRAAKL